MTNYEAELRRISRVLSEIAHALETSDHREARVVRALTLARDIVPARQCALLEVQGDVSRIYLSPGAVNGERERLEQRLGALYRLVAGGDQAGRSPDALPALALPVMGLDEIIGVIRVEPDGAAGAGYDARHLRLLSVIAAQLGSYLSMVRLRELDEAQTKQLAAAHDFQRLLAGVVGHDLRNPLAVIQAVASSLLETTSDEPQRKALQRALKNVDHATSLITDLVDVTESRVSGTIRVMLRDEDLGGIVRSTIEDLRAAHPTRTIRYSSSAPEIQGQCDALRFGQIVANLVNNAMIHGDPVLPIEVELDAEGGDIELVVRNRGPVIPPGELPTIFDPFKQGAPRARPHSVRGLGLGLYIVDCLARGHGGSVSVSSDAVAGTVFKVRVPRTAAGRREPAADPGRPVLVLIVDDDADVRGAVAALLEKRGYLTAEAEHGRAALDLLHSGLQPGLILLDLHMPVMDGQAFCDECARDARLAAIPVVLISSDTASAVRLAATRARAYLSKPVTFDRLLATIEHMR
jgi:signal transduction histidine kinase